MNQSISMRINFAFRIKSFFFSLLFLIYLVFVQPIVIKLLFLNNGLFQNDILAWILLAVPFLEVIGVLHKMPTSHYFRKRMRNDLMIKMTFILSCIVHLALMCLYTLIYLRFVYKLHFENHTFLFLLFAIGVYSLVFVKEAILLEMVQYISGFTVFPVPKRRKIRKWLKRYKKKSEIMDYRIGDYLQDLAGDGYLFLFAIFSITILWEYLMLVYPPDFLEITESALLMLYFIFIYLPIRIVPFSFEMVSGLDVKKFDRSLVKMFFFSFVSVMAIILWS